MVFYHSLKGKEYFSLSPRKKLRIMYNLKHFAGAHWLTIDIHVVLLPIFDLMLCEQGGFEAHLVLPILFNRQSVSVGSWAFVARFAVRFLQYGRGFSRIMGWNGVRRGRRLKEAVLGLQRFEMRRTIGVHISGLSPLFRWIWLTFFLIINQRQSDSLISSVLFLLTTRIWHLEDRRRWDATPGGFRWFFEWICQWNGIDDMRSWKIGQVRIKYSKFWLFLITSHGICKIAFLLRLKSLRIWSLLLLHSSIM